MLRPVFAFERQLPAWLRPAARGIASVPQLGTGLVGRLYLIAILGALVLLVGPVPGVVLFGVLLLRLMAAAAVGGAIYGLLWSLDQWGRRGAWLRAAAGIFGASLALVAFTPSAPFTLLELEVYLMAAAIAAVGGWVLLQLDERRPGRPTPGQFQWLQNHKRLERSADRRRARRQRAKRIAAARDEQLVGPVAGAATMIRRA